MEISFFTLSTPTFNNIRVASALPYHLIKGAKENENVHFKIYSFNINNIDAIRIAKIEEELHVKIHLLRKPWWIKWMFKLHLGFLRILLRFPYLAYLRLDQNVMSEIEKDSPDILWIYGEEIMGLAQQIKSLKSIVTMPDCESLFYYRMLKLPWNTIRLFQTLKYTFAFWQYRNLERRNFSPGIIYHFVGKADADFFETINPQANVLFLPHPLYAYNENREINFHQPKVKLLFTGRYDFYCQHSSDELLSEIERQACYLVEGYEITFLGKGWERWNERLRTKGFTSSHIVFAPDYIEELQKHDIQVNAIDVGTGTKGKVLDAVANGLLVIGTSYAFENIIIENGKSCIQYHSCKEIVPILLDVLKNKNKYCQMAISARKLVLKHHDKKIIAKNLFS